MRELVEILKALADESRLRALCVLQGRELCVCQIVDLLRLAPSTVSKHMTILRQAGLVASRKKGRWIYYRFAPRSGRPEVREAIRWVCREGSATAQARKDVCSVEKMLRCCAGKGKERK